MPTQDFILIDQLFDAINNVLFAFFSEESFDDVKAEKYANDISRLHAKTIANKAVEICGESK